jgi:hypothetical protein
MSRVDAAVLRRYALPIDLEHALLSLFTGWERVGVSFEQTRFLPEEVERRVCYADFVDYETDWSKTNRRRGELIQKRIKGTLSGAEHTELDGLQAYAGYHIHKVAPRPTRVLDELEDLLLAGSSEPDRGSR